MILFSDFYLSEKSISLREPIDTQKDKSCVLFGQRLADRFGLILNGWQEITFMFTIPQNVPNARNTFTAKNEEEIIKKLEARFPDYLDYIMKKNFPNGYKPDSSISKEPPDECEPMDLSQLSAYFAKGNT